MNIIYLNGEFLPKEQAKVSVFDRGFLFADGVYEVVPVWNGHLLGFDEHINRLERSLVAIHMQPPLKLTQWKALIHELLEKNQQQNSNIGIYLQVTRGADQGRDHSIPTNIKPTIVAFCLPEKPQLSNSITEGFAAITLEDSRRRDCYIKSIGLLPNILLHHEAKQRGAIEAILIRQGEVTEGTISNVFIVKKGELLTPPISKYILGGITRELVLELAKNNNIPHQQTTLHLDDLEHADEIWITGSRTEICPIVTLNGKPVGSGKIGPLWHTMMSCYEKYKR